MKAFGLMINSMDKARFIIMKAIFTQETLKEAKQMVTENI